MNNWKPIKSAPKDGASVMLYAPAAKTHKMVICHYHTFSEAPSSEKMIIRGYWRDRTATRLDNATHWHELPALPSQQQGE